MRWFGQKSAWSHPWGIFRICGCPTRIMSQRSARVLIDPTGGCTWRVWSCSGDCTRSRNPPGSSPRYPTELCDAWTCPCVTSTGRKSVKSSIRILTGFESHCWLRFSSCLLVCLSWASPSRVSWSSLRTPYLRCVCSWRECTLRRMTGNSCRICTWSPCFMGPCAFFVVVSVITFFTSFDLSR